MAFLESRQKKEKLYRHGGREVLRVTSTRVTGNCATARHTEALVSALESYAERALLPLASGALDMAMANGKGYAFHAHRYRIEVAEARTARGVAITLRTVLDADGVREEHTLETAWTQDGAWQKGKRHHRVR